MTAHTPGPWSANLDWIYADADEERIARVVTPERHPEIGEANARLIAAAPDMLTALKYAEPFLRRFGTSDEATAVAMALAAIAKAEGRS